MTTASADHTLLAVVRWERAKRRRALVTACAKWVAVAALAPAAVAVAPLYAAVVVVSDEPGQALGLALVAAMMTFSMCVAVAC